MKGINISCTSQASTAIFSSMEIHPCSSSSSSSSQPSSSLGPQLGSGRTIDRHNPLITDSRRVTRILSTPCNYQSPISPKPKSQQKTTTAGKNSKKTSKKGRKLTALGKKITTANGRSTSIKEARLQGHTGVDFQVRKSISSLSRPADLRLMKGCSVKPGDYISPPESSRYLLDHHHDYNDDVNSGFLDVFSDFDPVLKLVPYEAKKSGGEDGERKKIDDDNDKMLVVEKIPDNPKDNSKDLKPPSSSSSSESSDHQVVVLRVSLHCKGCEGKVRKHISRMKGVKSFNIDFAAKKVTVVGDVTPLSVLASISKVKNAQLWTPPKSSSSPLTTAAAATTPASINK